MLKPWMKWLPLVLVEAMARRKCERVGVYGGSWWCQAFDDVLIKVDDRP